MIVQAQNIIQVVPRPKVENSFQIVGGIEGIWGGEGHSWYRDISKGGQRVDYIEIDIWAEGSPGNWRTIEARCEDKSLWPDLRQWHEVDRGDIILIGIIDPRPENRVPIFLITGFKGVK
jgi:hypothetical protein